MGLIDPSFLTISSEIYGKPFYYLLGNVDILFINKISYKVYKIPYIYQISNILHSISYIIY